MSRCAVIRRMSSYGAHQPAAGHVSGNADISMTSLAIRMHQQQLSIDLYFTGAVAAASAAAERGEVD